MIKWLVNSMLKVALLSVGSAILLCSCSEANSSPKESKYDTLMTEYSENRTIIATENGVKKYIFYTPLLEGYTAGKEPYREFRKGVKITTFKEDSVDVVDVTLTANYAIYFENRKLWEAKGDVVVVKSDGKTLYTDQLFWNAITKKIYSNVDSKIVQPDGEFLVSGFESDEDFHYWSAREMDGHMQVEFAPTPPDTTRVDSLKSEPKSSEQREPARPFVRERESSVERPTPPKRRTESPIPPSARRRRVESKPAVGDSLKRRPTMIHNIDAREVVR